MADLTSFSSSFFTIATEVNPSDGNQLNRTTVLYIPPQLVCTINAAVARLVTTYYYSRTGDVIRKTLGLS